MKKVALLLWIVVLAGVALGIPTAASTQSCTCAQEQAACTAYCTGLQCRRATSTCDPNNPCAATCACGICIRQ
jgi:hypothetical protein